PDVELGPVRQREHAHRLAAPVARVVEAPQLRALVLRVPAMLHGAEGEDPLLRARLLLVAAGTAERGVEPVLVERLLQSLRLHHVGVHHGTAVERVDAPRKALLVHVHEQVEPVLALHALAKRVHVLELPRRVDVQERERRRGGMERLPREVQHRRAVLADRVEHHRVLRLGDDFAHDVDRLRLEPLEVGELQTLHPSFSSFASTIRADSAGSCLVVSMRSSGSTGSSYGSETPVNSGISPARALAYRPFTSRRSHSSTGVATCTSTNGPNSSTRERALRRASAYGEIADTITAAPARVSREATQPMRAMFASRSSFEKPRPCERCVRTTSPSSRSTSRPRRSSCGATSSEMVVLPEPESPVNHTVKPVTGPCGCRTRSCRSRPSGLPARPRPGSPASCTGCSRWTDTRRRAAGCTGSRSRGCTRRRASRPSRRAAGSSRRRSGR